MRMSRLTPTQRRDVLAVCAGHEATCMTLAQRTQTRRCLLNWHWIPTADDTPVPWATIEAWYRELFEPRRSA